MYLPPSLSQMFWIYITRSMLFKGQAWHNWFIGLVIWLAIGSLIFLVLWPE
jgi:hypothetical protein